MTRIPRYSFLIFALFGLSAATAPAQIVTSVSPSTIAAGSKSFVLTVNGSGFDQGAVVELDGQPHETLPSSSSLLKALVFASDVASGGTISVTVVNSNGSASDAVSLTVTGKAGSPPPPPPISSVVTVTISSPSPNKTVCSPVTLSASAVTTSKGAKVERLLVEDQNGNQLYSLNGVHSIDPALALAAGAYNLTIYAYDSAGVTGSAKVNFTVTTATSVCGTKTPPPPTGPVASFRGCTYNQVGLNYQAVDFTLTEAITLPFDAKLYYGPGCSATQLADEFGFGQKISFDPISYIFWFNDYADDPDTSAIWTVGSQSSGCVNYSSVPSC